MRKEGKQETRIEEAGGRGTLSWGAERHCEGQSDEKPVMPTSHKTFSKIFMHLGHTANLAICRAWVPGVEPRPALESGKLGHAIYICFLY